MTAAVKFRLLMAAQRLAAESYWFERLFKGQEKLPVQEELFQSMSDLLRRESGLPEWDLADLLAVLTVTHRQAAHN